MNNLPKYLGCPEDPRDDRDRIYREVCGAPPVDMPTREQGYDTEEAIGKLIDDNQKPSLRCVVEGGTNDAETMFLAKGIRRHFSRKLPYPEIALPNGGAYPRDFYKFWNKVGLCEEHLLPSFKTDGSLTERWARTKGNITQEILDNAAEHKCDEYLSINPYDIDFVRQAIFENNGCGGGYKGVNAGMGHFVFPKGWGIHRGYFGYRYKDSFPPFDKWIINKNGKWYISSSLGIGGQVIVYSFWTATRHYFPNTMTKLERKKGTKEVFISLDGKRYWIKEQKDFETLKKAQPIKDIEWGNIKQVDEFDTPYGGKIIGSASFVDFLKRILGIIK